MRFQLYTEQVKELAFGKWDLILQETSGLTDDEVNPRKNNMPCPCCGGYDRYSFMSIDDGNYICRQCGAGDGFSLIMKVLDCGFAESVQLVGRCLGVERQTYRSEADLLREQERLSESLEARLLKRERAAKAAAVEKHRQQALAAQKAAGILTMALPAKPEHPYLMRKQLPPFNLKQCGSRLLIPLYTHGHHLVNIEHITSKGEKFGLKGGQREAVYHRFGSPSWTVYICEGWATGASLYLMEQQSIRVYAAMGKGNLTAVSLIAKEQNPDSRLFIAADNDTHLLTNPGLNDALKAAEAAGAAVMLPPAIDSNSKGTDFSDFYIANGGYAYGTQ